MKMAFMLLACVAIILRLAADSGKLPAPSPAQPPLYIPGNGCSIDFVACVAKLCNKFMILFYFSLFNYVFQQRVPPLNPVKNLCKFEQLSEIKISIT